MNWAGRRVLVTGGTRGIGRALLLGLQTRVAKVRATGRSDAIDRQAATEVPSANILMRDLVDPAACARLTALAEQASSIRGIHSAGIQALRAFTATPADDAASHPDEIGTNLLAPTYVSRGVSLPAQQPRAIHFIFARGVRAGLLEAILFMTAVTAGCATTSPQVASDPFEPVNRAVFRFNETADRYLTEPLAEVYDKVLPSIVRTGVRNFFNNLGDVVVLTNDLLQLKFTNASRDLVRLVSNTVFGGLGLVDVAGMRGLAKRQEDFGQTLAHWGIGSGPYIVLPLLGPTTLRDSVGLVVDSRIDPVWQISDVPVRNSLNGVNVVDARANALPAGKLLAQQPDRYSFLREAYLQRRRNLIHDGIPPVDPVLDLDDPGEGAIDDSQ
jgi:phospholipid-binding lipoprotein MlaA